MASQQSAYSVEGVDETVKYINIWYVKYIDLYIYNIFYTKSYVNIYIIIIKRKK